MSAPVPRGGEMMIRTLLYIYLALSSLGTLFAITLCMAAKRGDEEHIRAWRKEREDVA